MGRLLLWIVLLAGGVLVAATVFGPKQPWHSGAFSATRRVVSGAMRDPASVQFRNMAKHAPAPDANTIFVCGEYNAKNALGAYVGFRRFVVTWQRDRESAHSLPAVLDDGSRNPPINHVWPVSCGMPVLERAD